MKFSRRHILALAGTGMALSDAALSSALAQTPAPAPTPADRLATAREDNRKSAEKLTQFQLPVSTEPSFIFRA